MNTGLWVRLTVEGQFDLIRKLARVEKKEDGFMTIVVPPGGFSEDDTTHNMVLDWLEERHVNVLNVGLEVSRCRVALYGSSKEF